MIDPNKLNELKGALGNLNKLVEGIGSEFKTIHDIKDTLIKILPKEQQAAFNEYQSKLNELDPSDQEGAEKLTREFKQKVQNV